MALIRWLQQGWKNFGAGGYFRRKPKAPPVAPAASSRWLRWYWRLRETPALPYDALLMLWLRVMRRI